MRPQFEAGHTVQFTFTSSVAPDAPPAFAVRSDGDTIVASDSALTSGSSAFYSFFTMPSSADGTYMAEWTAQKTVNGIPYPFLRRILFNVVKTKV